MASCNGSGDPEIKTWDASRLADQYSYTGSSCEYTDQYEFELAASVDADRPLNNNDNPVVENYARMWLSSYFTELPDGLIDPACRTGSGECFYNDCYKEQVKVVQTDYHVRHPNRYNSDFDNGDYDFVEYSPRECDDDDSADWVPTVFSVLASRTPTPYDDIGLAVVQFLDDLAICPVNFSGEMMQDGEFGKTKAEWNMFTDSQDYQDLPDAPCSSNGVYFKIQNASSIKGQKEITAWCRHHFRYQTPSDNYCQCEGANTTYYELTTPSLYNYLQFESQ